METWLLTVKSYTEASNGRSFLQSLSIKSSIEKMSGSRSGCGYALRIWGDPQKASRLLGTAGVKVQKIISGKRR